MNNNGSVEGQTAMRVEPPQGRVYCGMSTGTLDRSEHDPKELAYNVSVSTSEDGFNQIWKDRRLVEEYIRREFALADPKHQRAIPSPRPSVEGFIRHARRFGPEQVVETARVYLTAAELGALEAELATTGNGKPGGSRQRRTTGGLADQVAALQARGLVPAAIADALNISDRRAAELLTRSRTSKNGGHKPSVQAKLFAA